MRVVTIELSTKELVEALKSYVLNTYEIEADQIVIRSHEKEIVVTLSPTEFIHCDEITGHYTY